MSARIYRMRQEEIRKVEQRINADLELFQFWPIDIEDLYAPEFVKIRRKHPPSKPVIRRTGKKWNSTITNRHAKDRVKF